MLTRVVMTWTGLMIMGVRIFICQWVMTWDLNMPVALAVGMSLNTRMCDIWGSRRMGIGR
jgi:hypothetical protein